MDNCNLAIESCFLVSLKRDAKPKNPRLELRWRLKFAIEEEDGDLLRDIELEEYGIGKGRSSNSSNCFSVMLMLIYLFVCVFNN